VRPTELLLLLEYANVAITLDSVASAQRLPDNNVVPSPGGWSFLEIPFGFPGMRGEGLKKGNLHVDVDQAQVTRYRSFLAS
jgi:hypothetical protein